MVQGGQCQSCGRTAIALIGCKSCGSRVCHQCVNHESGFCKLCGGIKKI